MTKEKWAKLTDEEKRIKIAELCGWMDIKYEDFIPYEDAEYETDWRGKSPERPHYRFCLPDYLNDLNAMHEAEKLLTDDNFGEYAIWLERIGDNDGFSATAAQRALAFVLTLATEENQCG